MAEWIKRPLGMEVGLGPGDFVLDGDPAPPRKKGTALNHPIFGPCLLWPNDWMDEDATWYGSRPQPRPQCVRRGPSFPSAKGAQPAPLFSAHVYCGHGRPSQLLLSSCYTSDQQRMHQTEYQALKRSQFNLCKAFVINMCAE